MKMRRSMAIGLAILAVLAVVGIGVAAYSAGVDEGMSRELAQRGDADQVVRVVGHGYYGWGRGFGFPFGLILFPLFVIGIVLLVRGAFGRGRWGGPGWWGPGYRPGGPGGYGPPGPWGGPAAFDDWHRRQHEQPPAEPGRTGDAPAGPGDAAAGGRDAPAGPGAA
jgi:hypothetical protein